MGDSGACATALLCGVKGRFETVGLDDSGVYEKCESSFQSRIPCLADWAQAEGRWMLTVNVQWFCFVLRFRFICVRKLLIWYRPKRLWNKIMGNAIVCCICRCNSLDLKLTGFFQCDNEKTFEAIRRRSSNHTTFYHIRFLNQKFTKIGCDKKLYALRIVCGRPKRCSLSIHLYYQ